MLSPSLRSCPGSSISRRPWFFVSRHCTSAEITFPFAPAQARLAAARGQTLAARADSAGARSQLAAARSHIQIADPQRVLLDENAARIDHVAHQGREDLVRGNRVLDADLQ